MLTTLTERCSGICHKLLPSFTAITVKLFFSKLKKKPRYYNLFMHNELNILCISFQSVVFPVN